MGGTGSVGRNARGRRRGGTRRFAAGARQVYAGGLSLVELLVVFVLLGLVSTLLLQGLGFFSAQYEAVERWRVKGDEAELRQHWFLSTVHGLLPYGVQARRFRGTATGFAAITLQSLAGEPGMPVTVRWSLEDRGGVAAIIYEEVPVPGRDGVAWTVADLTEPGYGFQYADTRGRWNGGWPVADRPREWLPSAIRLASTTGDTFWHARVDASSAPLITDADVL